MGIFDAISSFVGGLVSAKKEKKAAQKQMDFQADMSSTAHQREVEDLRKAGLNPILSAGGKGASTPSGSKATVPDFGQTSAGVSARGIQRQAMKATVKQTETNTAASAVQLKYEQDALKAYEDSPAIKKTVIGGMLGNKARLPGPVGAIIGGGTSARSTLDEWDRKAFEKNSAPGTKKHYDKLNQSLKKFKANLPAGGKRGRTPAKNRLAPGYTGSW